VDVLVVLLWVLLALVALELHEVRSAAVATTAIRRLIRGEKRK